MMSRTKSTQISLDVWRELQQRTVYLTWFTPGLCISTHPDDISASDFSKAFDRIGYNVLMEKLLDLGVRTSLIPWIISFLSNRRQRVKLDGSISDWLPITPGVPQGTKLGPILFLVMINHLNIRDPESCTWKYVDDVSLSEGLVRNSNSTIQTSLDTVASWSSCNWMKLNAK